MPKSTARFAVHSIYMFLINNTFTVIHNNIIHLIIISRYSLILDQTCLNSVNYFPPKTNVHCPGW